MKQVVPNLLKAIGVLAISALVIFVVWPEHQYQDKALNAALEFLGSKLLAMVPQDQQPEIEREFDSVRERALSGEVDSHGLEDFAASVLNAEAEGRQLQQHQIDSTLKSLHKLYSRKRTNLGRLQSLAGRLRDFEKFEHRWKRMMADSSRLMPPGTPRPPYRISPEFVIQVDSAAIAALVQAQRSHPELDLPPHAPLPDLHIHAEMDRVVDEISRDLELINVELDKASVWREQQKVDSLAQKIREHAMEIHRQRKEPPPPPPTPQPNR